MVLAEESGTHLGEMKEMRRTHRELRDSTPQCPWLYVEETQRAPGTA